MANQVTRWRGQKTGDLGHATGVALHQSRQEGDQAEGIVDVPVGVEKGVDAEKMPSRHWKISREYEATRQAAGKIAWQLGGQEMVTGESLTTVLVFRLIWFSWEWNFIDPFTPHYRCTKPEGL